MTTSSAVQPGASRRVVLIDFDWQDADLLPILFKRPELSIRLVAGARHDDPGLKAAELCGLPRTVDIGDLTREIFDLALVSERSTRRTQIEGLLRVLGTPCLTPQSFLEGTDGHEASTPAIEAPIALHAAALETSLGGAPIDDIVEEALPDLTQEADAAPKKAKSRPEVALVQSLEDFPTPEDRRGLEQALLGLMTNTGASAAELHTGPTGEEPVVVQVGHGDGLMKGLVNLALSSDEPQVVKRLAGPDGGKAWGAWPFRTEMRRGVLAAAAIDPAEGWTVWEKTVEDLRDTWDRHDRDQASRSGRGVPEVLPGWLDREEFCSRLEAALERGATEKLRPAVRRIAFPEVPAPAEQFCSALPGRLRDTDSICRPAPFVMLLLTLRAGAPRVIRQRMTKLFEQTWRDSGPLIPVPALGEEEIVLGGPEEVADFRARVLAWLGLE